MRCRDNELIARVINSGDHYAFATLIKKYQSSIRQFLRRLTAGDHAVADDIAQESFLKCYQKLDTFLGQSAFNTWLHKIAYNCFLKFKQKAYHQREVVGFDLETFETTALDIEKELLVERLMASLDISERTCITLSVSAGMSHTEICVVTNLPLGTVKSHINRGKKKLIEKVKN